MSRLSQAFDQARKESRAAFIAYLTAGDPSAEATLELAKAVEGAGADVLELGVPFSDPIADGPVLQRAAARALDSGTTLEAVFEIGRRIRRETRLALVLFTYLNPVHRMGAALAAKRAASAGFDGVLLTDVPPEEASPWVAPFRDAGLDTVFLVSPNSPAGRMREAARLSSGFLYVVSRLGTTGPRASLPRNLAATVGRARKAAANLPIAIGFGISTPEAARRAARLADGVVVGSALVAAAESAGTNRAAAVGALAGSLAAACGKMRARA